MATKLQSPPICDTIRNVSSATPRKNTGRPSRLSPHGWTAALVTLVSAVTSDCALQVSSAPPQTAAQALRCIAVLPFENRTSQAHAGDAIAELMASALVVSDRYNVVEPSEARGILDSRGLVLQVTSNPTTVKATAELLGVDAAFAGVVLAYNTPTGVGPPAPVVFNAMLVETRSGSVLWTGDARYNAEDTSLRQPVIAGLARDAADALVQIVAKDHALADAWQSCAKPIKPVLAEKVMRKAPEASAAAPIAAVPAAVSVILPAAPLATPTTTAPVLSAPTNRKETSPAAANATPAPTPTAALTPMPAPPPVLASLSAASQAAKPAVATAPTANSNALPALPDLPASAAADLPALPRGPDRRNQAANDTAASPAIPDLPEAPVDVPSTVDEYAGLPYAPAAPEPPPATKAKLQARQKSLLRQIYVGMGITRRWFARTTLLPAARTAIADLASLIAAVPDLKIAFEIHADVGNAARSQPLSQTQQTVLQNFIETKYPALKARLFFRSLGNSKPIAKDITARAHAQNTRVEIRRVY